MPAPYWTKDLVIEYLKEAKAGGKQLNSGFLQKNDKRIYQAMRKQFGSWEKAILAADLDPAEERIANHSQSQQALIDQLLQRKKEGKGVNCKALSNALYRSLTRYFGSWEKAIIAAGLDPVAESTRTYYSREEALAGVVEVTKKGKWRTEDKTLWASARYYFGSWENAVIAAGLDPLEIKKSQGNQLSSGTGIL